MKEVSAFIGLVAVTSSVTACDLCSVYSANQARGDVGKGFHICFAEQFTHFGTLQEDGVKVPSGANQYLNSSVSQAVVGYNFTERFGVQLNLPIISRSFRRPEGLEMDRGSESGIGDLALIGTLQLYRVEHTDSTFAWTMLGGVKFPTGSSRRLAEELNESAPIAGVAESGIHGHDLTLGSGSYDGIIGTGVYFRRSHFFASASTQYSIREKGDFDYRFANDLTWLGGPGVFLAMNENYTVTLQANISGEHKGRDSFAGEKAKDTGITSVFIGPQFGLTWSDKFSVELGLDLPVILENTSLQVVPDYRIRLGVTWHF